MTGPGASEAGDLWRRAAAFAERAHHGQFRRDGVTPYASHAARVAMTVARVFGCHDDETIAIAWLHDTIEDTTTDYEDLLDAFGPTVADGVAALSKNPALPEAERERVYDETLERAGWRPKLVKLADVLDNMLDHGSGVTDAAQNKAKIAGRRARLVARVERAIGIAERDTDGRPEITSACRAVRPVLRRFTTNT